MRIALYLDKGRLWRWQVALAGALRANGHDIFVQFRQAATPLPTSLTAILDFDGARLKSGPDRLSTRLTVAALALYDDGGADVDLTIDLSTSDAIQDPSGRVLRPVYDGSPKDAALFHALLAGRAPFLAVSDSAHDSFWQIGLPALETPSRLAPSLDQTVSRLIEGLVRIVIAIADRRPHAANALDVAPEAAPARSAATILRSASAFTARRTMRKIKNISNKASHNAPRWHIAWRNVSLDVPRQGSRDLRDFHVLPDDGARYFADPFIFAHDGQRHVFLEEVPSKTGIGVISHLTILADGHASAVTTVLDTGSHLSYPHVFARDGDIWMLPESAAAGGLDLYRAEAFPDRWTKHARLIEGRVHDATIFEHDGLLWIAAGSEALQSSTWDALSLFYAECLNGPWRAHPDNPVIVDARAARPAGPLWLENGQLYRPAQNCSGGYGSKISIKRVTKLSPQTFAEEPAGEISFGQGNGLLGPHTIQCSAGLEVVDVYARPRAIRAP